MKLVIDMPKEKYNVIKSDLYNTFPAEMKEWGLEAIRNGTPLVQVLDELKAVRMAVDALSQQTEICQSAGIDIEKLNIGYERCKADFSKYESPIQKIMGEVQSQMIRQEEEQLMMEIKQSIGYAVDKYELIKALEYDRKQYEKGYKDALEAIEEHEAEQKRKEEEMKTLDEAILHVSEVARTAREGRFTTPDVKDAAEEYEQYEAWLRELKARRDQDE